MDTRVDLSSFEACGGEVVVSADSLELRNVDIRGWREEIDWDGLSAGRGIVVWWRRIRGACVEMVHFVVYVRVAVEFFDDAGEQEGVGSFL